MRNYGIPTKLVAVRRQIFKLYYGASAPVPSGLLIQYVCTCTLTYITTQILNHIMTPHTRDTQYSNVVLERTKKKKLKTKKPIKLEGVEKKKADG